MKIVKLAATLALACATALPTTAAFAYDLTIPVFSYRTGPYASNGTPVSNGINDYFRMLQERDGGIGGATLNIVECETAFKTDVGVECYENLRNEGDSGALFVMPFSTAMVYQLIPKATEDGIPILSTGYGRASSSYGSAFSHTFNFPINYWSGASIFVNYVAEREGGFDALSGKKIALVYHNSAYGKEPIPTLTQLAETYGFELELLPIEHPGQEQKSTWLRIRRDQPDYIFMWGWGIMNSVAIKEAVSIGYPMDQFLGVWWSGSEEDVKPAGAGADGYISATFHGSGELLPVHQDIIKYVYDAGNAVDPSGRDAIGQVLYNRGLLAAMYMAEAIRTGMEIHGTHEIRGEHVRDGLEALNISSDRWAELGAEGLTAPIQVTCANHEGPAIAAFQQWDADAEKWNLISDYFEPDHSVVAPLISADARAYASETGVALRDCP